MSRPDDSPFTRFLQHYLPDTPFECGVISASFLAMLVIILPQPFGLESQAAQMAYFALRIFLVLALVLFVIFTLKNGARTKDLWETATKWVRLVGIGGLVAFVVKYAVLA